MTKSDLDLLMLISRAILNAHYVFMGINNWTWDDDGDGGPNEHINAVVFHYALDESQRLGRLLSVPNFLSQEFYSPLIDDFTNGSKVGYENHLADEAIVIATSPEYFAEQEEALFDESLPFVDDVDGMDAICPDECFGTLGDVNTPF